MAKEMVLSGCAASAQAAKMAKVEVICSYPIRPYTALMMELAKMVANGELDAEFIYGEGEHAQLSVVLGASAAGARVLTGSSGVGVTYAFETYSPIAGGRVPVQMMIADRALDPPGDFGSEHTDAMSCRDQGWLMGWAENPQEAFDNCLINYRVGEDHRVLLPQFVCQDGYFVSHIPGKVLLPDQSQVDEFLPPYTLPHPLDPKHPVSHGPQIRPDQGTIMDLQRAQAHLDAPAVIKEAIADFNRIFGRDYSPFVEEYMTDDAEMAFFIMGAHTMTARHAIKHLRSKGVKIGLVKLRFLRPWPTQEVAEALSKFKAVGVVETSTSYGGAMRGGNLLHEVRASLYDLPQRPLTTSFMAGLGGEMVPLKDFYYMAEILSKMIKEGKTKKTVHWVGFEAEA
ncbi:MAG: pyruvate ferredoxin oxidoreductase [candidate division NC10 bacterium RIFCSPLOWO2_12_FULL_66_18]|nr:MAG: pyruvate ferredoxin oxidoreductase [candidate division NC10 bacterium RIFCSPLOWO2_02_FULL_66_22]OGC02488.1 MAG: pyruvate ferredoxin oxidoreductase [candidate division NC10 bacterium RIFCSPLOWO2_12_FULL_66_18]